MKDTIIVSWYDCAYSWSIYIDGYVIDREELRYPRHKFPKGLRQIAKEVFRACWHNCATNDYYLTKFRTYNHIVLCEDGCIEILK